MRIAAPEFGSAALVEVRLAFGALVLLPLLWTARKQIPLRMWPRLALIGLINSAIPFLLFAWSAQVAPAAISAICNATTVLFAALMAFVLYRERLGARRLVALLVGFSGVVVLATSKGGSAGTLGAVAAATSAALLYGLGANLVRRHLLGLPAGAIAAATLLISAVLLAPVALLQWPQTPISMSSWCSAAALGALCTGFAYLIYYRLIQCHGAARAAGVTYLIPLFAAAWAWLLLGEAISLPMLLAGGLILASVAINLRSSG